jgi:hypothetical protein
MDTTPGARSDGRRHASLDSNEVERRIGEWRQHVLTLFGNITEWSIRNRYTVDQSQTISMDEEMMQLFAVQPIQLPVLKIRKGRSVVATIVPVGLWVIGANGRLDILTSKMSAMVVNASPDPRSVRWMVYPTADRSGQPLNEQRFLKLIA